MAQYSESMERLIGEFNKLPGIGRKSAERLAFHVLRATDDEALALAAAVRDVKENTRQCSVCANVSDGDPCAICADPGRDHSRICVVEEPTDVFSVEGTGLYRGLYHVLMGRIAPLDGADPEMLTIDRLCRRVAAGGVQEVILATDPDADGDGTALYVSKVLDNTGVKVTRLARGLPAGSSLEHVGAAVLADALRERHEMS